LFFTLKKKIVVKMISKFPELIEKLKVALKLNQYEAEVVLTLILRSSPQTAKQIAEKSSVPIQRVYDVLERLKTKGLIIQTARFPKTYVAKRLELLLKKRLVEERIRLNEWQHEEIKRISEEKQRQLNYLMKESRSLVEMIKSLRKRPQAKLTRIAVQVEGWNDIQELLIQLLREAESTFWGVSRPPDWRDLTTLGTVQPRELSEWYEAIDVRDVDVRWLTSLSAIPSYIGYVQATYLPRRLIEDNKIPEKYVVVDGEKVLINLRDPETGIHTATAVLIESPSVAKVFEQHFKTLWKEAIPTEKLTTEMKKEVEQTCHRLKKHAFTNLEIRVYRSLLRMGASSAKNIRIDLRWADKEKTPNIKLLRKTLDKLAQRGIIEKHKILDLYLPKNPKVIAKALI
jgi:sugar-specific transcriptional regulator TrmB